MNNIFFERLYDKLDKNPLIDFQYLEDHLSGQLYTFFSNNNDFLFEDWENNLNSTIINLFN